MKKTSLIIFVFLIISCSKGTSYVRSMLPETATKVKEYYQDRGFSGDYIRLLKAKATKEDYENYALTLNLTEKYSDYLKISNPRIRSRSNPNLPQWWDEPKGSNDFYFIRDSQKEYERRLKWKNGWLYLATEAW